MPEETKPRFTLENRWFHCLAVLSGFSLLYVSFFGPALFNDMLIAPGDGFTEYAPLFFMKVRFWNELVMCGYPYVCDPQSQIWYPLAWFFRALLKNWNAYVVSVYVLSSCFAYGLTYSMTRSKTAGIVGGLVYGMNGWLMSNAPHNGIIHSTMWLPLVVWSFEELRKSFTAPWFIIATLSIATMTLAGHTQMTAFLLLSVAIWIVGQTILKASGRLRLFCGLSASLVLGLGISMIAMFPALEFSAMGFLRLKMRPDELLNFYYPMQIFHFIFPFIFGGCGRSPYGVEYFGAKGGLQSVSCYVGISTITLAVIGVAATFKSANTRVWLAYSTLMLFLALGDLTPIGQLIYLVPIYSHLRCPTRHMPELIMGIAVLSALGVANILKNEVTKAVFGRSCALVISVVVALAYPTSVIYEKVCEFRNITGGGPALLSPMMLVPIVLAFLQLPFLLFIFKAPKSKLSRIALIVFVLLDLGSFGWYLPWRYDSPSTEAFIPPPHVEHYRSLVLQEHQRILPVRGICGTRDELMPNLSAMWEVPSASGYENFITERYFKFLNMPDGGFVLGDWNSDKNRTIDIAAIRYVFNPKNDSRFPPLKEGARWHKLEEVGTAIIYENLQAMPRIWLTDNAAMLTAEDVLKAATTSTMPDKSSFEPLKTALVEEPDAIVDSKPDAKKSATITKLTSERMEVEIDTEEKTFLVTSDVFHPGWKVTLDGKPARVVRTDYLFRGLPVPQGKHTVLFYFEPTSLLAGQLACGASLGILALICFRLRRNSRAKMLDL